MRWLSPPRDLSAMYSRRSRAPFRYTTWMDSVDETSPKVWRVLTVRSGKVGTTNAGTATDWITMNAGNKTNARRRMLKLFFRAPGFGRALFNCAQSSRRIETYHRLRNLQAEQAFRVVRPS